MGAVAEFVGDAVGGAFEFVGDVVESVGDIALDAVEAVGDVVVSIGEEVGKIAEAAVNDPIGTIAKVAAIATQQYWALPLISAATVVANGGDIGQALVAAGISYAAGAIAVGVGDYLGAGAAGGLDMAAGDAANLASMGLTASQITEVLAQSYPEIGVSALTQAAGMATLGMAGSEIAADVGRQMATQNLLASAAGNAVGGATRTALGGGDIEDVLMGGLTSGAGTVAGGYASSKLKDFGINNTVANTLGKATGAATASTIAGKDGKVSFINSLINTTLTEGGKQVRSGLKTAWNGVNETVTKYNDQLNANKEIYESKLSPLEQEAKAAQEAAVDAFDKYKPIRDQFSDLVKQYDEAKEAGDTQLANSLADQANALIPSLNDATTAYNDLAETYSSKLASYESAAEQFMAENKKLDEIKTEYEARNADLQKTTAELTEAGLKVADMGDNSKAAFEKIYNDGSSVTSALDAVSNIDKMSDVAQGSFLRQYEQNKDLATSLEFANQINALDPKAQASYAYAVNTGLDDAAALQYAPNLSGLSKESQQIFLDGIKSGQDPKAAETSAALAEFFKQFAEETSQPSPYAPTAGANTTGSMTDVGGGASTPLVPAGTEVGVMAGTTFQYNPATGRFDIPIPDTTGGTSNAGAIESSSDRGAPLTAEQLAAGEALDARLSKGEITQAEYDTKLKEIEGMGTTTSGTGFGNVFNNPNLADDTFTSTNIGNAPTTGTAPVGTPKNVENTPPPGFVAPTGPAASVMDPWYNTKTGETYNAPSGGWTSTDPNWQHGRAGEGTGGTGTTPGAGTGTTPGTGTGGGGTGTAPGTGTTPGTGTGDGTGGGTGTGTGGTGGTGTGGGTGGGMGGGGGGGYGYNYGYGVSSDAYGSIKNLTPGLTQKMDYTLSGIPNLQETASPIPNFAAGSSVSRDPFNTGIGGTNADGSSGINNSLTPGLTKAQLGYVLTGMPGSNIVSKAEGGSIEEHNPQFFSEGGLGSIENRYVNGEGDGTSDEVPAMLANGEFVIPADVVSALGNGSNEAGAGVLDQFLASIRDHKHSKGSKGLPPDSKGPLSYLTDAKRKAKA